MILSDIVQTGFTAGLWDTEDVNGNFMLDGAEDLDGDGILDQETFINQTLDDLDLQIFDKTLGLPVEFSTSDMDSIEHGYFDIPSLLQGDDFAIRVLYFNDFAPANLVNYGVAWIAVPEPGTVVLMGLGALGLIGVRRRRRRA